MKLNLHIGTSDSESILEILTNIYNDYPLTEIHKDINEDDSLSTITVEVEDKVAFVEYIERRMENYDFDPLSSVTDLEGAVLWSDSIF